MAEAEPELGRGRICCADILILVEDNYILCEVECASPSVATMELAQDRKGLRWPEERGRREDDLWPSSPPVFSTALCRSSWLAGLVMIRRRKNQICI